MIIHCSITVKRYIFFILIVTAQSLFAQNDTASHNSGKEKQTDLTVDAFNELINGKFILVYLNADWCAICKKQQPILEKIIKEENGRIELLDIDTEANPLINEYFEVDGLPKIILYKNGVVVWQYLGLIQENTLRDSLKRF